MVHTPHGARNHRARWTIAEMEYVENHYQTYSIEEIAEHLGRTTQAVKGMAMQLKCSEKNIQRWNDAEKAVMYRHYDSPTSIQAIFSLLPGRSRTAVMAMASKMGLSRPGNDWTEDELHSLYEYYPKEGQSILRRLPAKSDEAIREKARQLEIASPGHTQAREWGEKDWLTLSQNLHLRPVDLLSLFPHRSLSSIKNALVRLKRAQGQGKLPIVRSGNKKVTTTWSEAEKAVLTRWYETSKSMDEIVSMLPGRPRSSVFSLARKMGLSRQLNTWSEYELQVLRDYYPTEGSTVVRRLPDRKGKAISMKAFQLGLHIENRPVRQAWSQEERIRLEKHLHLSFTELQLLFPERSPPSLKNALNRAKARQKS